MNLRTFGPTGQQVYPIGFGGMPLSIDGRPGEADALRVLHAAFDAGMTLIDTADVYCIDDRDLGHNERLIAKALATWPHRDRIQLATKGGLERPGGDWTTNGDARHLQSACEASLKALAVSTIWLYQLHAPDDRVPFEDSVGALAELQRAGKIVHVGLSNVSVDEIERARRIVPIVSVQNRCNLLDRRAWAEGVVDYCEREGLAFLPYSPVGGGRGKRAFATHPALASVAKRHDVSTFRVALAWLLAKSPAMLPIPAARTEEHARDSAAAATLELSSHDVAVIDAD